MPEAPKQPNRLRSLSETADILNMHLTTLRRLIDAGDGPRLTRLSPRVIGVTDQNREKWLAEKERESAGA
ncbi:MAG: hypothetical protein EOS85_11590 [Mesorhizobium sp.]|nr:MAG: hypothetical protein EOS85_11590 [Mesorhizobium sp.]